MIRYERSLDESWLVPGEIIVPIRRAAVNASHHSISLPSINMITSPLSTPADFNPLARRLEWLEISEKLLVFWLALSSIQKIANLSGSAFAQRSITSVAKL